MTVYLDMSSGFNHEREVEQLLIAINHHHKKVREVDEYIEKLEEARAPGTGKTEQSYQVIKLIQNRESHKDRIREIVFRIRELEFESEKPLYHEVDVESFLDVTPGGDETEEMAERNKADEESTEDGYLDDIFSDDKIPPEFHLDHLESQLDYNLGQVDGFTELAWKSKCKLARLAVDHDLSRSELETILDLNQGDNARGVSC
jgi:hypothetical protein